MPRSWALSIPTAAEQSGIIYNTRGFDDPRPERLTLDVRRQITCPAANVVATCVRSVWQASLRPKRLLASGPPADYVPWK